MLKSNKNEVVQDIKEKMKASQGFFLFEYHGLTVSDMTDLRKKLRAKGGEVKVYKNTFLKRAIKGMEIEKLMTEECKGPIACAFGYEDVVPAAKMLVEFEKNDIPLAIKMGVLNNKKISLTEIKQLAKLPSREIVLSQFVGTLAAPIRLLVNVLSAIPRNFVYVLKAIEQQKMNK